MKAELTKIKLFQPAEIILTIETEEDVQRLWNMVKTAPPLARTEFYLIIANLARQCTFDMEVTNKKS